MNENSIRLAMETGNRFDSYGSQSGMENAIRWSVADAMKLRGQSGVDEGTMQTIIKKICEVILRDYPSLTDKEFNMILDAGIAGEFGKETWVSGALILQWLRQYQRHPQKINVIDNDTEQAKQSKRKTKEEIEELNRQTFEEKIHSAFEYYKECRTIWSAREDERARRMDENDPRCFHLPQWAAIVYNNYREAGKIKAPTPERIKEAQEWGANKVAEHATKKEYIKGAREDWADAYLLEKYFEDLVK